MRPIVNIEEIVDALGMQPDEMASFVNLDTGAVETIDNDLLAQAEESPDSEPDLSDWQEEQWEIARNIASTDRYKALPSKHDVHEWAIMDEFIKTVSDLAVRNELAAAIRGPRAFRKFKDILSRHETEQAWYNFRDAKLREIAIQWCEENQIAWR